MDVVTTKVERVLLAAPRGFCAGVEMAIKALAWMVRSFDAPVYCYHEIVHNKLVVERFEQLGVIFVDEISEVPEGSPIMLSAHGSAPDVVRSARSRGSVVIDSVCPLVTKVHMEVRRYGREGRDVILIGHDGHPEVEGTLGRFDPAQGGQIRLVESMADAETIDVSDPSRLAFVTQTTLSVDDAQRIVEALRQRFPSIVGPKKDDICYATQNRQDAVKFMARQCDLVIVVGSPNSSNSNRLREVAAALGCEAYMVDGAAQLQPSWVNGKLRVGVTAGASAPEVLVQAVVQRLKELGAAGVTQLDGIKEGVTFPLPKGLALPPSATILPE